MQIPSSPPVPPDHGYMIVPRSSPHLSQSSLTCADCHSRKRSFCSDHSNPSSDPLFSDATASSDDTSPEWRYPSKKRFIRCPWYHVPRKEHRSRVEIRSHNRTQARNNDSGVWMGSDETDTDEEHVLKAEQAHHKNSSPRLSTFATETNHSAASSNNAIVLRRIQDCLDSGQERVDLSGLSLDELHGSSISLLHQLIKPSHAYTTSVPVEEEFTPLIPEIQLFLASNQLRHLPPELFRLSDLTVLSLRNNNLTYLDASIGQLVNLKELNIAGNQISYLPWELQPLLAQERQLRFIVRPNPLLSLERFISVDARGNLGQSHGPSDVTIAVDSSSGRSDQRATTAFKWERSFTKSSIFAPSVLAFTSSQLASRPLTGSDHYDRARNEVYDGKLVFLVASQIIWCGADGNPLRRHPISDSPHVSALRDSASSTFNVPSLRELSLCRLKRIMDGKFLSHLLHREKISEQLAAIMNHSINDRFGYGLFRCSSCRKQHIVPRAYWFEFWYDQSLSSAHRIIREVLPFLRMACSWGCARAARPQPA